VQGMAIGFCWMTWPSTQKTSAPSLISLIQCWLNENSKMDSSGAVARNYHDHESLGRSSTANTENEGQFSFVFLTGW